VARKKKEKRKKNETQTLTKMASISNLASVSTVEFSVPIKGISTIDSLPLNMEDPPLPNK
jgi:hypothetical protein